MYSFSELGKHNLVIPGQEALMIELVSYDVLKEGSCKFIRGEEGSLTKCDINLSCLHWSRQFEWPWAIHYSKMFPNDVVLDAGGGMSILKYAMAKRCKEVICLDNQHLSLESSERVAKGARFTNIRNFLGNIRAIPFPDNYFDKVFCISVLEHIEKDHIFYVKELLRVLRPGGTLILTLDVRVKGPKTEDFFLDPPLLFKICEEVGIPPVEAPEGIVKEIGQGVGLMLFMTRLIK